jgi:hypothetical protein
MIENAPASLTGLERPVKDTVEVWRLDGRGLSPRDCNAPETD